MPIDLTAITIAAIVFGSVWIYVNIYFVSPVYRKVFAKLFGFSRDPRVFDSESTIPDADVPTVDVLVPAYNERDTIGSTIRSLREANYPAEKLTVNVLVEASDHTTRAELFQLHQLYDFRELVVPAAYPGEQNKPRALNYGFEQTSGDIVGVIDAEDIVDPRLFRQVVRALVEGGHDYAQGPLDLVNEGDGFLNTLFRGEYGFWYGIVIPSFLRVGYPVPLGGTTNFAWRTVLDRASQERLDRLGDPWTEDQRARFAENGWAGPVPWDPRNVTEDFELGLLLWETGHSLAMVTATTREESPIGLNGWVRQRTRWQKGKIYTFYHRLRTPPISIRRAIHVYSHAATPHLGPMNILAILLIMIYANLIGFLAIPSVAGILLVGLAFATQQLLMQAWGYWQVTDAKGLVRVRRLMVVILGVPLYWVLQWGADARAGVQLLFRNLGWEKTVHRGRHFLQLDPTNVESVLETLGLTWTVTEDTGGWTWAITADEEIVAASCREFPTEVDARSALESFYDLLPVVAGAASRFEVTADRDGHEWVLTDSGTQSAHGLTSFADSGAAIGDVGYVKAVVENLDGDYVHSAVP